MIGNNIIDNDNVIFNIIKTYYINDLGYILSGYLKQGKLKVGMKLNNNINMYVVQSIHNNKIDCTDINAPATISIRINKLPCQNEQVLLLQEMHQLVSHQM
jgi:GTPase